MSKALDLPKHGKWNNWGALVCALAIDFLYFSYYIVAGWLKAENFTLGARDTAIYQTGLWQAGEFLNPIVYVMPGIISMPLVGAHFMPMGFVYGLIYRYFPQMLTTVSIYALSFAVSGFLIFLTARNLVESQIPALVLQIAYLANFTPALGHFYLEDWATPYIAAGLYFFTKKRLGWATVMWIAAMMFKEYIGLAITAFGLAILLGHVTMQKRSRDAKQETVLSRYGMFWFALGLMWFSISFWGIMRFFQPSWVDQGMFSKFGDSDLQVMQALLTNPFGIFERVISPAGLSYLAELFLPFALLPLIGIEYSFAIAPIVLLNFLAHDGHALGANEHYTTMIQPFLAVGAAVGLARVSHLRGKLRRVVQIAVIVALTVFALSGIRYHAYKLRESFIIAYALPEHTKDVREVLAYIGPAASVAADENLLPFLAQRRFLSHRQSIVRDSPTFLLLDSLYGPDLARILDKGASLNLQLLSHSTREFYDRASYGDAALPDCQCEGYKLVMRRGSLTLFAKE